jgi:ADP-heptose:LPS heptosyltransferase
MGRTSLSQLLSLIRGADGMVAGSTGPLHIAAALGRRALGLYPGRLNDSAFRWRPLGRNAETISFRTECLPGEGRCPGKYAGEECSCMTGISPEAVAQRLMRWVPPAH